MQNREIDLNQSFLLLVCSQAREIPETRFECLRSEKKKSSFRQILHYSSRLCCSVRASSMPLREAKRKKREQFADIPWAFNIAFMQICVFLYCDSRNKAEHKNSEAQIVESRRIEVENESQSEASYCTVRYSHLQQIWRRRRNWKMEISSYRDKSFMWVTLMTPNLIPKDS